MSTADEEFNRLKATERAAQARLERLSRTEAPTDEVHEAEELWKDAVESLRDYWQSRVSCSATATRIAAGMLVAAKKVRGTRIYNPKGDQLGVVDDILIDKVSGKVIYAIIEFGGFLGLGEKRHPLPWSTLTYDEGKDGYIANLDLKALENAPSYDMHEDYLWTPEYGRRVDKHYNVPTYW